MCFAREIKRLILVQKIGPIFSPKRVEISKNKENSFQSKLKFYILV